MARLIIGLYSNFPQSGKSTVAKFFEDEGYVRVSIGEPVKKSLLVVLDSLGVIKPEDYLWGDKKAIVIPELGITGGFLMSSYATSFFRDIISPDVWLNCLVKTIDDFCRFYDPYFVIDDMRFPNEFEWIKSQGGYTVKVCRQSSSGVAGRLQSSEGQLKDYPFDFEIDNSGTVAYTRFLVKDLCKRLEK